jgi:hypothetical protein
MTDSNANLAIIDEIYAAYNRSETAPLMNALADDFEMHEHAPDSLPWGGDWKGRAGMEDFLAKVTTNMTHQEYVCDASRGHDVSQDLLGDDRPDVLETFYLAERHWVATGE